MFSSGLGRGPAVRYKPSLPNGMVLQRGVLRAESSKRYHVSVGSRKPCSVCPSMRLVAGCCSNLMTSR